MEDEDARKMYHTQKGVFDLSRLVEQLIPSIIIGAVIVYANNVVVQSQVGDLRARAERQEERLSSQNEKLISLNAQVASYLSQQNQLNTTMDARLTYVERISSVPAKK